VGKLVESGEHFRTVGEKLDSFWGGGAWVRSSEYASRGGRIALDRTRRALSRRLLFFARCARCGPSLALSSVG